MSVVRPCTSFHLLTIPVTQRSALSCNNNIVHPLDKESIPVAARSKTWVCGRLVARSAGSNPARGMDVCLLCLYVVLFCVGRGLCEGLITRPGESYRLSNCMCVHRNPERGPVFQLGTYRKMNELMNE
jgi:hypothetical protein